MRGLSATLLVTGSLLVVPLGCTEPPTCAARGVSTILSGISSYAVAGGSGHTESRTVTIDDYVETCSYDDETFPIRIGDCTLWATLERGPEAPSRFFPGDPSAWAAIEPGQGCELSLGNGTAQVTIDSGTIAFADSTTGLFLSGAVTQWTQGNGASGPLEWQFQSGAWPL